MVISIILVLVLVYLSFALGIAYWILTHSLKQDIWLKILGLVIGGLIITFSVILLLTTAYYSVKHRHDYYKQCPVHNMMQMHQSMHGNPIQQPCPMSGAGKTK